MKIGNVEIYGIIYKIKNQINGKIYIGQTIHGFNRRYKNNLEEYTKNIHLKNSIDKYGILAFIKLLILLSVELNQILKNKYGLVFIGHMMKNLAIIKQKVEGHQSLQKK